MVVTSHDSGLTLTFLTLTLPSADLDMDQSLTNVFKVFNLTGPALALLMAMAITPIVWILRNKKMKDAFMELLNM